ncbi:MAG: outer membrane protein assembly factor BamD [Bacteroidaceae bacterium]|nr:outer membrane protein assembly factor BamD [Bacteroidaceae bacterium]
MNKFLYIILVAAFALVSCDSYNKVLKMNDVEYKYEEAKALYMKGEYNKAATLIESVVTLLKGSDKADESMFILAMCYYDSGDYVTAAQCFKACYSNYPRGNYAEIARFYSGKSLYMNVPEPALDQSDTYTAIEELQLFMEYYPASVYSEEAQKMMFEMHDVLVMKDYLSAKLYYDLGDYNAYIANNYQACIITAQNALKDYPYTKLREELYILILRARYQMADKSVPELQPERYRETVDEFYAFKNEFPTSKYMAEAETYYKKSLERIGD